MTDPTTPPTDADRSLLSRVLSASYWAAGLRGFDKLVAIVRVTVLARLLSPDDFGLFGIALLALSLVEALSHTGLDAALIQRDTDVRPYLSTAWTLQLIRSALIAGVLVLVAPLVAAFFDEPSARPLLQVLSINALLLGMTNIGVTLFAKELQFQKQFAYMFSGTAANLVVSVWAAFELRNAWALVIGMLAGTFVRMAISHLVAPRVRWELDRERAAPLLRFGRWVWSARIAHFVLGEGDDVLVGKLLGTDALGLYRAAYLYGNLPATEITHVVSSVSFPAYAKLQGDPRGLREAFIRTLRVTAFVSTPAAIGLILVAPGFVRVVLGGAWMPMVGALQILTVWGLIRSFAATSGALLTGAGRPDIITKTSYFKLVVFLLIIYPLTVNRGIEGAALAVVAAALVANPITSWAAIKTSGCTAGEFVAAIGYPLLAAGMMAAAVRAVQTALGAGYGPLGLLASIAAGVAAYGLSYLLLRAAFGYDIADAFRAVPRSPEGP